MFKYIQIIEISSGLIVTEYPINNYESKELTDEEHCNEAWELAVDDELVNEIDRDKYLIEVVDSSTFDN